MHFVLLVPNRGLQCNDQHKGTFFFTKGLFFSVKKKGSESEKKSIRHRSWDNSKKNMDQLALSNPEKCIQEIIKIIKESRLEELLSQQGISPQFLR